MRTASWLSVAVLLIMAASAAHAQYGGYPGRREYEGHRHRPTHADSTRTLAGAWQVWGHAGIGWLGSPGEVRSRYNGGLDVGASGDRRLADRVAFRARLDYHDLPSKQPSVVIVDGIPFATNIDYGHGWCGLALGGIAVRTWNHLWLEGGAGEAYFRSGFPNGQTYLDISTGHELPLTAGTGFGAAWSVGARYEFQPSLRDRLLGECQFYSMDRAGTTLHFWALRVGYRAL